MSNSVFNVTEPDSNDSLTLVVSPDGTVSPDKETVKSILSSRPSVDINLMTVKKVEAGKVNVTLDNLTYVHTEEAEDPEEMDEIARNLLNFRMDHDYTPFTSPTRKPQNLLLDDELAQTLSMLEGGGEVVPPPLPASEPLTKITKIVKGKKQTLFVNSKQKAKMISTGLLKEKPNTEAIVFKKPKPVIVAGGKSAVKTKVPVIKEVVTVAPKEEKRIKVSKLYEEEDVEEEEDLFDEDEEDLEDDENDSDFELEEELKQQQASTSRNTRLRRKSDSSKSRDRLERRRTSRKEKIEPEVKSPEPVLPVTPIEKISDIKVIEKKPIPKKEKKVPKPIPDDFALFSTPDIIRRVGKEPISPEKPLPPKPAKISLDYRSKSTSADVKGKRLSTDNKSGDKSPEKTRRLSLEVKKQDRRPSIDVTPKSFEKKLEEQVSVQDFNDTLNNSNESMHEDQLEPLPSAEDIRAIIQNENTKSFSTSLVIPDPGDMPVDDQNNLEAGGLDLDQSILDNINTDLINEDILYQVAQSLVGNAELQNAIDKSIVDGNLVLDPALQQAMAQNEDPMVSGHMGGSMVNDNIMQPMIPPLPVLQEPTSKPGTQIVRPDGRVVVIPPIERPTTRSRNRQSQRAMSPQQPRQPKPVHKPLDEEHVSGNELDSSDEEEEDESEDDPNKLWCICNQPHNNRFMICCDTCEEWYHGKCVNVTKAMGQMMEAEGKEWICVYCRDASLKRPKAAARRIRKASRTSSESGGVNKKTSSQSISSSSSTTSLQEEKKSSGPGCVVCGKPSRNSSIYCSDTCILKHAQGVEKVVVFDRKSGKLLSGSNAPSAANLNKWLAENPTYEVVRSANKQVAPKPAKPSALTQSKLKLVKNKENDGVSLAIQKKGVSVGVLRHTPKSSANSEHIKTSTPKKTITGNITGLKVISKQTPLHQSKIKVIPASPITSRPTLTATPAKAKSTQPKVPTPAAPAPKEKPPVPQKTPKARQAEVNAQSKPENLRDTVKKTFFEQLSNRLKAVPDLKLSEDELKGISDEIESQLYKCFGDTGQKYKNKYRSLIFNIKDPKNQTLWRRICEKSIKAYQLVRLSPDDLASQELALWREREAKHQLDMIKKSELELLNCSRQFVFKTHKGEQVYEEDRPKDQVTEVISGLSADSTSFDKEEGEKDKDKKTGKHKRDRSKEYSRDSSRSGRDKGDSKERKKERRSTSRDRKRRSKSKERSSRHSERKRSRSRDRHRRSSHKSSKYRKEEKPISTERLDKKSKEILEQLVDKHIVPPLEDRLWKHVPQEDVLPALNAESDSDHEPSSTVTIPTPPRSSEPDEAVQSKPKPHVQKEKSKTPEPKDVGGKSPPLKPLLAEVIWKGVINMIDVAQISITAHEVSGDCQGLGIELPSTLDIVGRISHETVWDYISKMKSSNSKTISIIRLTATNMEERMPYLALYSYLSSRDRLGVVKSTTKAVKDFYILPLAGHTPIPDPLLPLSGPGFEDNRPALLLGIIVRDRKRRAIEIPSHHVKRARVEASSTPASSTPPSQTRSYTPPPNRDPRVKTPSVPLPVPPPNPTPRYAEPDEGTPEEEEQGDDMDEPYSPEDSDPDVMPDQSNNSRLNAEDISNLLTGSVKTSSFLDTGLNTQTFEPFSNKFDTIPGLEDTPTLPSNSLELQRKMAELDQRIAAQKAEIDKVSQDLASTAGTDLGNSALANIALPSDLQQILESIKTIGSKTNSVDSQGENSNSSIPSASSDLTIPLLLPKLSSRALSKTETIPLNLPKHKPKTDGVLSSLSEEDLIKKAEEMLAEVEPKRTKDSSDYGTASKRQRPGPIIPGINDE